MEHASLRNYIIGFVLAVVLSVIPFWLVATHALPPQRTLLIIGIAAVLQVLVHLRFFLHINFTTTPKENILALVFTCLLLFIMVGGSFWIMFDLHQRMSL
ncbi:MAG: cytochrome o ubiquinol oxidase subunit IV [Reyranella sp.]|jgi:cytochrome o ubiquinol oxidase operon protein cyoD|nr:MAG: cytochrome o ubiquinol oxidase subunit IV [Reyranella sp.]